MTPRSNVIILSADLPLVAMLRELPCTRHTKVPVYGQHRHDTIRVLYARDLMGMDLESVSGSGEKLQRLLGAPYFVPGSKLAFDLFHGLGVRKHQVIEEARVRW